MEKKAKKVRFAADPASSSPARSNCTASIKDKSSGQLSKGNKADKDVFNINMGAICDCPRCQPGIEQQRRDSPILARSPNFGRRSPADKKNKENFYQGKYSSAVRMPHTHATPKPQSLADKKNEMPKKSDQQPTSTSAKSKYPVSENWTRSNLPTRNQTKKESQSSARSARRGNMYI